MRTSLPIPPNVVPHQRSNSPDDQDQNDDPEQASETSDASAFMRMMRVLRVLTTAKEPKQDQAPQAGAFDHAAEFLFPSRFGEGNADRS